MEEKGECEDRRGVGGALAGPVRCCQDDEWEASVGCEDFDGSR